VHFTSDGTHIYWLYTVTLPDTAGKNDKDKSDKGGQELVYLETILVKVKFSLKNVCVYFMTCCGIGRW